MSILDILIGISAMMIGGAIILGLFFGPTLIFMELLVWIFKPPFGPGGGYVIMAMLLSFIFWFCVWAVIMVSAGLATFL